jgi:peptidoglycan/xylan/chitin deacetylase (PgdA/CDA1 family)
LSQRFGGAILQTAMTTARPLSRWLVPLLLLAFSCLLSGSDCNSGALQATHLSSGCSDRRQVALTFDDGPNPPYTQRILDILRAYDAKATFFVEGEAAAAHPDLFTFIWAVGFFFMCVEAVDRRRWAAAAIWAVLAVTTHPFAGAAAVIGYTLFAALRRPRDAVPLFTAMAIAALVVLPYALYVRTTPSVGTTRESYVLGTLRYMARFRGAVVLLPLVVSMLAPLLRALFLPAFAVLALTFGVRIEQKHVNTFGFNHNSHPFYGEFIRSPQFDLALTYRVLEPNDPEDGAYQLIKHGAVLAQEFFDQSQFRQWWNSPEQYSCFLGAKGIDVVLLEKDYPRRFSQNEDKMLAEFEQQGKARVIYRDPEGRFTAYDVRDARRDGARFAECGL